ncbi:hypothetical protein AMATHDRAFT_62753 [Amanita thiersii Skay4041]|uniref:BTB domain-containing protein n=1 Tax=Amanita thiersii Skay4041 TaxID=703135 RepID=A0A2A9NJY1_9AGAR|nr:hypothetical protein AMATHDRAFT_62753 [Amanita thiersii Skay4041]
MESTPLRCPVQECNLPVDVIIKSSDDKYFGAHTTNLEVFSSGFAPASLATSSPAATVDPVCLTESGDVLELLLRSMHSQRPPDLSGCTIKMFMNVAEAAEKYLVHHVMEICRLNMYRLAPLHPNEVFAYALKHRYPDLLDQTAPETLSWDAAEACEALGGSNFIIWVLYRERWLTLYRGLPHLTVPVKHKGGVQECEYWDRFFVQIVERGLEGLTRWNEWIGESVDEVDCTWCSPRAMNLRAKMEKMISLYVRSASELANISVPK